MDFIWIMFFFFIFITMVFVVITIMYPEVMGITGKKALEIQKHQHIKDSTSDDSKQ